MICLSVCLLLLYIKATDFYKLLLLDFVRGLFCIYCDDHVIFVFMPIYVI